MNNSFAEYSILKRVTFPQFLESAFLEFLEDIFSLLSAHFVVDEKSVNFNLSIIVSLLVIVLFSICSSFFPLSFEGVQYSVVAVVSFRSIRESCHPSIVNFFIYYLKFSLPNSVFSFWNLGIHQVEWSIHPPIMFLNGSFIFFICLFSSWNTNYFVLIYFTFHMFHFLVPFPYVVCSFPLGAYLLQEP